MFDARLPGDRGTTKLFHSFSFTANFHIRSRLVQIFYFPYYCETVWFLKLNIRLVRENLCSIIIILRKKTERKERKKRRRKE